MVEEKKIGLMEKYRQYLRQAEFKTPMEVWVMISLGIGAAAGIAFFIIITLFSLPLSPLMAAIVFFVLVDIFLGYPYIKALRRTSLIEEALPDALKQMADTLKAGGTYEYALREISTSQYGPLTKEIGYSLRKLEEGENLENSLNSFANRIDSRLIKRSIVVIIDSIKAGAGLAEVLDEIAEDIRAMHRIAQERKSETALQVMFMIAAGAIVAPIILGLISSIIGLFIVAATNISSGPWAVIEAIPGDNGPVFAPLGIITADGKVGPADRASMTLGTLSFEIVNNEPHINGRPVKKGSVTKLEKIEASFLQTSGGKALLKVDTTKYDAVQARDLILLLMQLYIMVEIIASSVMISLMRDGSISKSIIYIPVFLLVAYIVYYLSSFVSMSVIGGFA